MDNCKKDSSPVVPGSPTIALTIDSELYNASVVPETSSHVPCEFLGIDPAEGCKLEAWASVCHLGSTPAERSRASREIDSDGVTLLHVRRSKRASAPGCLNRRPVNRRMGDRPAMVGAAPANQLIHSSVVNLLFIQPEKNSSVRFVRQICPVV